MNRETPRKKFDITNSAPPYQPSIQPEPKLAAIQGLVSSCEREYSEDHKLYIKHEAAIQIFIHIGWGTKTIANQVEQGGILLGQVYKDEMSNLVYGIVEAAIPGRLATGSGAYLEMTHETWKEMLDSTDKLLEKPSSKGLQIIGWYHTHPNNLSVFMSGTDQATQSRLFAQDWQFAIVLNPHKKIWRSFYGAGAKECKGFIIADLEESKVIVSTNEDHNKSVAAKTAEAKALNKIMLFLAIFGPLIMLALMTIIYLQITLPHRTVK